MSRKKEISQKCVYDFSRIDENFAFKLGKVKYTKAHQPLEKHIHKDMIEIVYIVKGEQVYSVDGKDYVVKSGEVFMTFADELHSTGCNPEDKALFYYFIIDLDKHKYDFIGYGNSEGNSIIDLLNNPKKRVFKGSIELANILDKLIQTPFSDSSYKKTVIRNLVSELLLAIIECTRKDDSNCSSNTMININDYIEQNIYTNISISELAEISGLSETRFKMNFKKQFGMPPHEYVLRKKIAIAKRLLLNAPNMTITDVAFTLSFSSSQYFATVFKRFTCMSPKDFKVLKK